MAEGKRKSYIAKKGKLNKKPVRKLVGKLTQAALSTIGLSGGGKPQINANNNIKSDIGKQKRPNL
tara:strand:- start:372 stop:566 length:195 start_codon:yes stop_codon:yes gene_type:complete